MLFARFSDRRRRDGVAHDLYGSLVRQARLPAFYQRLAVADSVDGRFDMVLLHAYLVMRHLGRIADGNEAGASRSTGEAGAVSQSLFDLMFADMDQNLREMGVGDLSVGRKVKEMAQAFYGRVAAYDAAIGSGPAELAEVLRRNLYRARLDDPAVAGAMAAYLVGQDVHLAGQEDAAILAGRIDFLPPEA